ncbi:MAG: hypothetical protein U1E23_18455 [Reyranellaceae bacterium]
MNQRESAGWVAVNRAYGDGFRLSEDALQLGRELSGRSDWNGGVRHDPVLVEVVRRLGVYASDGDSLIELEQLCGPIYRIDSRSGYEQVVVPCRATGWVEIADPASGGAPLALAAS